MRDTHEFIYDHPFKGEKVKINGKNYILGSIVRVIDSRRLYIETKYEGSSSIVNFPFHEISKILFDEENH